MKPKQSFKDYLKSKPDFKQRHYDKMYEEITCDCGITTRRYNLSKHKKTKKHLLAIGDEEDIKRRQQERLEHQIITLTAQLEQLKKNT